MILKPEVHHPNDVTAKYMVDVIPENLHKTLGLPGKFVKNYPTRIVIRDGSEREMDWLMLVEPDNETLFEKILINVEFQSSPVDENKIKVFSEYKDYAKTYYGLPVLTVVVITNGYEKSQKEYTKVFSDVFRPYYIHMSEDEVMEKLNNIEKNIDNLSDDEAVYFALLPMFASKKQASYVTEKLVQLFKKNTSIKGIFRNDIAFALSIMVRKYFDLTQKGKELLKMMDPEVTNTRLRDVIDFEVDYAKKVFQNELKDKDEELSKMSNELSEMGNELLERDNKISEMGNELLERDNKISEMGNELSEMGNENNRLKRILEEHNIQY